MNGRALATFDSGNTSARADCDVTAGVLCWRRTTGPPRVLAAHPTALGSDSGGNCRRSSACAYYALHDYADLYRNRNHRDRATGPRSPGHETALGGAVWYRSL